jgi:histidine triad (HIT) family protein
MANCTFCRIASGEIQSEIAYSDSMTVAFHDANPQAPRHILLIPRKHVSSLRELSADDEAVIGHIVRIAVQLAEEQGIADGGFRLVANSGPDAGQSVDHVHFHLLGGRRMGWPPG